MWGRCALIGCTSNRRIVSANGDGERCFRIELAHGSFTLFAMRLTPFALGFSLVLVSSIASAAVTNYKVHLTQAPTWQNDAGADVGDGTFTYDDANQTLTGVVNHTIDNAFSAKLYYREGDAGFGGDKTIKSFKDTESPIGVAVKLKAEQATALANSQVHFQVGSGINEADGILVPEGAGNPTDDAGAGDASADTDSGSTDPGNTDPGNTDPGNTDPGNTDTGNNDSGNDSTNSGDSNSDGSEEEEESSGKKSGCSVIRAGANDPATIGGASLAGLFGIALLARRRRKG